MPQTEYIRPGRSIVSIGSNEKNDFIKTPLPVTRIAARNGVNNRYENVANRIENELTFYPAYCFKISPTWFAWVKLTTWEIHHNLKPRKGFYTSQECDSNGYHREPSLLLFYLNHPVQFVQVAGVVVNFEEFFEKFWLFTIDDGSGATIDITCWKPVKKNETQNVETVGSNRESTGTGKDRDKQMDTDDTTMHLLLSSSQIIPGTVLQAKGTLTTFRHVRQLNLNRLTVIPSTAAEMSFASTRLSFYKQTLSKPWFIDARTQEKLRNEAHGETSKKTDREKRRKMRELHKHSKEMKYAEQIQVEYDEEEKIREEESNKAREAGELLRKQNLQNLPSTVVSKQSHHTNGPTVTDERTRLLREAFGK